jgi:hypothetical protein
MSALGHLRPIDLPPEFAACPLHPESGQTGRRLAKSALCQKRTYALQQKSSLFDHLVGKDKQGSGVVLPNNF